MHVFQKHFLIVCITTAFSESTRQLVKEHSTAAWVVLHWYRDCVLGLRTFICGSKGVNCQGVNLKTKKTVT